LSTVWIEADVYERNLPFLHVGQEIEATVEALPAKTFDGYISLIYPQLNPQTRTNRIRVTVENPQAQLRPGMFATVRVQARLSDAEPFKTNIARRRQPRENADDAALIAAQKICPVTGLELGSMGKPVKVTVGEQEIFLCCAGCQEPLLENPDEYLAKLAPPPDDAVLSVPEQAVIDTGRRNIVYVEREPGIFEGVEVEIGPRSGGYYPVISGLAAGDRVAAAGSFLLDAETRLNPAAAATYFGASGRPSQGAGGTTGNGVTRGDAKSEKGKPLTPAQKEQIDKLPPADRELALAQHVCPVTGAPLGSMGVPVKVMVEGRPVFLCCKGCESQVKSNPKAILKKLSRAPAVAKPSTSSAGSSAHQH
jgi:hypothetical protein